jgi:HEAT repeat protein
MILSHTEIRSRIDELKLSYDGYTRQLGRLDITVERRGRLEAETALLREEIATLEKLVQLGRVEPDREVVESLARERLAALRVRMNDDPDLAELEDEERDQSSGEARALVWALGEDPLTRNLRLFLQSPEHADPSRTDRMVPGILIGTLENSLDPSARANAAYDLGKLGIEQAIPALSAALNDASSMISQTALESLRLFTTEQLRAAGLDEAAMERIREA